MQSMLLSEGSGDMLPRKKSHPEFEPGSSLTEIMKL